MILERVEECLLLNLLSLPCSSHNGASEAARGNVIDNPSTLIEPCVTIGSVQSLLDEMTRSQDCT